MMSQFARLIILVLLATNLGGQDLNSVWTPYMSTNSSIAELERKRVAYNQEQIVLKSELDQLQQSSEWYNAWINKYLMSNRSQRQLVILDSLTAIDEEMTRLLMLQESEIKDLKLAYEGLLKDYEEDGIVPAETGLRSLQVGRLIRVLRPRPILFPDYTEILRLEWRKPEQRRLFLQDIQHLLQVKISELESLHSVRMEEEELAIRLADFHQDLGLQMEADQDAQQRDASGESEKRFGWGVAAATGADAEFAGNANENLDISRSNEASDLVSINVPREDAREMSLEQPSGKDLEYLGEKLAEYKDLLENINQELNQSP